MTANKMLFGTAGIPHSTEKPTAANGVRRIKELGLGAMELEFVQRAQMKPEHRVDVKAVQKETGIFLSAHAPYYVNLNSEEQEKLDASRERIIRTAEIANDCGADSVIFHPAFYMKTTPREAYNNVKAQMEMIIGELDKAENGIMLRPETMGKPSQFGSLEECVQLSKEFSGRVLPCVDFSHLHARTGGKLNTFDEFISELKLIKKELGAAALRNMHCHISGIEYTNKGERKHLVFAEADFAYNDLMKAFAEMGCAGIAICESPSLEDDALLLHKAYNKNL